MIFRCSKGNVLIKTKSDPIIDRDIFIIVYPGEEIMKAKLLKFCDSL